MTSLERGRGPSDGARPARSRDGPHDLEILHVEREAARAGKAETLLEQALRELPSGSLAIGSAAACACGSEGAPNPEASSCVPAVGSHFEANRWIVIDGTQGNASPRYRSSFPPMCGMERHTRALAPDWTDRARPRPPERRWQWCVGEAPSFAGLSQSQVHLWSDLVESLRDVPPRAPRGPWARPTEARQVCARPLEPCGGVSSQPGAGRKNAGWRALAVTRVPASRRGSS